MSSNKKRRELNRAIEEHDRVKLSAQFAVGNHSMLNIAESILAKENAALKAELKAINAALDDPRTDLTLTAVEVIVALKEQITRLEESIEELTRKYQKHAGNYYASQDALAKLQSKSAALVVALERIRGDLWLQIESKHGPKFATNYPSILTADAALAAFKEQS